MIRTIVVIEQDGLYVSTTTLLFDVPNGSFDLIVAARMAAADFCKTAQGRKLLDATNSRFNWGDFYAHVPQEYCEKYGFRKIETVLTNFDVDMDEQLVDTSVF